MTVVKAPVDPKGFATVTYQCHNPGSTKSGMCLAVVTYTDSARFPQAPLNPKHEDTVPFIRPGDLGKADFGWKDAVNELLTADQAKTLVAEKKVAVKKTFDGIPAKPEYPGSRLTVNVIAWNYFWDHIMKDGSVSKADLEAYVRKESTVDKKKVELALADLRKSIQTRSGYIVGLSDGRYRITGKGVGGKGLIGQPYSDEAYRKLHGFPV